MNREIKFRIWDIENKEMLEVQELDFEPTFYGGRIAIRPDQYNDYFDTEDMILMQYTGLHDKNGKEIYEGDILKSIQWNDIYLVKYIGTAFYLCRKGNKGFNKITTWNNAEKSEVVGNIYDNPELLGGE
mgnify:CR=1 FL=1